MLDDDHTFWSSWWLLFSLLALAFVSCPGLPRGDLGSQLADHTLQLPDRPGLALLHRGGGEGPRAQVHRWRSLILVRACLDFTCNLRQRSLYLVWR